MSGDYPDLVGYDDDFLVHAFQIHCPAPTSVDDAICMQNAYTAFHEALALGPWIPTPSFSQSIGPASTVAVDDFQHYIRTFAERAGLEFLETLMADEKKCGVLYCEVGIRNARVARLYMTTLKSKGKIK